MVAGGCGRVGFELLPMDAGSIEEEDADLADADLDDAGLDAGPDMDAEPPDAGPLVDGCVLTSTGECQTCQPDAYVPTGECGVGFCRSTTSCLDGIERTCTPGTAQSNDVTCDGIDDDCNGSVDEDYVAMAATHCGTGVCARSGMLTCVEGSSVDTCKAGSPRPGLDDESGPGNGLDDDCDGRVDEDVSLCDTAPRYFEVGVHMNIPVPTGCSTATIEIWGGAGAAGMPKGYTTPAPGGRGGAGGYARSTLTLMGPLTIYVGNGGAAGCENPGTNPGAVTYSGGGGGLGNGERGADGMVTGGGAGADNLNGWSGGRGHFGGGGGGASGRDAIMGLGSSQGGGGGAATVVLLNGTRVMVAGGGGGGGGASTLVYAFGEEGGRGGSGCSGAGTAGASDRTGGGGGGGVCVGTTTSVGGTNGVPANDKLVPPPRARGTNADCAAGGNGYAIVSFAR